MKVGQPTRRSNNPGTTTPPPRPVPHLPHTTTSLRPAHGDTRPAIDTTRSPRTVPFCCARSLTRADEKEGEGMGWMAPSGPAQHDKGRKKKRRKENRSLVSPMKKPIGCTVLQLHFYGVPRDGMLESPNQIVASRRTPGTVCVSEWKESFQGLVSGRKAREFFKTGM